MGWFKDTREFIYTMWNPHYVAEAFRAPAAATREGRDKQSAEAHRYTQSAQTIAKVYETGRDTVDAGLADTAGTAVGAAMGLPLGPAGVFMGGIAGGMAADSAREKLVNDALARKGEAPVRSLRALLGGDTHYANGGSPDTHPALAKIKSVLGFQNGAQAPESPASAWAIGALVLGALGVITSLVSSPMIGVGLLGMAGITGLIANQKTLNSINVSQINSPAVLSTVSQKPPVEQQPVVQVPVTPSPARATATLGGHVV